MKNYWIAAAGVVLLAIVAAGSFYLGQRYVPERQPELAMDHSSQGEGMIDVQKAIAIATSQVAGEVLKVELEREDGRFIYEVKVLSKDGHVREIELDAKDGSVIEVEAD
jgi:uncharacterized membrane protein YkoI